MAIQKELIPFRVKLEPISHKYFDTDGSEYMSVSKLLGHFKKPFDSERMSWLVAGKELKLELGRIPTAAEQQARQNAVKMQWLAKNKASTDIGTEIHNAIEAFILTGKPDPKWSFIREMCVKYFTGYKSLHPETALYSKQYFVAGTSDLPCMRSKGGVIDIWDYKTNASKGILYHSDYGNNMLGCLSHLEECSYNSYCIQLSIYAYFMEEHGHKIGKLSMIYIPPSEPDKHFAIPVPYMKSDVINLLSYAQHFGIIKKQPQMISI